MKRPPPAENKPEFPPPQPLNNRNKKTRELPNLSDCFCCNRRINSTNPKNKLGILNSEWRIVLLCKSCLNLVESSQFCSYCLTNVSSAFYECKKCRRKVHKDCVSMFSFGGDLGDEFSVCVDCWIPKSLENEFSRSRAVRVGTSKKQLAKNGEKGKAFEKVVSETNADVERKIVLAIEAKEKAFTRVLAAKKAIEIASGALDIVAVDKVVGGGDEGGSVVDEDAQLAIRLHKEMNSSPRISRNFCSLSTQCVDFPKVNGLESRGQESEVGKWKSGFKGCDITYTRKGKASKVVKCKEEPSAPLRVYGRRASQAVKVEDVECQMVKMEAGQCSRIYNRKRLHCKSNLGNNSVNVENGDLATDTSLICHDAPRALANAS